MTVVLARQWRPMVHEDCGRRGRPFRIASAGRRGDETVRRRTPILDLLRPMVPTPLSRHAGRGCRRARSVLEVALRRSVEGRRRSTRSSAVSRPARADWDIPASGHFHGAAARVVPCRRDRLRAALGGFNVGSCAAMAGSGAHRHVRAWAWEGNAAFSRSSRPPVRELARLYYWA